MNCQESDYRLSRSVIKFHYGNNFIIASKQLHAKRPQSAMETQGQRERERETKNVREDAERDSQDYIALSSTRLYVISLNDTSHVCTLTG